MIVRLVQLKFQSEKIEEFLAFYEQSHQTIRNQPGCLSLSLLHETGDPSAFATWSTWDSGRSLLLYRRSAFFRGFWPQLKAMLREPAFAVTFEHRMGDAVPSVSQGFTEDDEIITMTEAANHPGFAAP